MSARHPEAGPLPRIRPARTVLLAVFLIAAGTFLFLSNIGLLPVDNPWSFWPAAVVIIGVAKLFDSKTASDRILSILMIVFGTLFALVTVGIFQVRLHDGSWPVSVLFIVMGIAGLAKALDARSARRRENTFLPHGLFGGEADEVNDSVVLGAWKRRVETQHFRGGQVQAFLGAAEIDLRAARINGPDWVANLEVAAVFGGIKLRIPDGWKVAVRGTGYLGNFEDKTIPQSREIADLGTLVITGYSVGSNIEIEN